LAVAYANGDGLPADLAAAIRWFQAAASGGHPGASQQLAFLREIGALGDTAGGAVWRVQLATVANEDAARMEWRRLQRRYDMLANVAL
ncbi:SEL1-like repeat protein, partial [Acinetobacter baumannii]